MNKELGARVQEHEAAAHPKSHTFSCRPVELVWSEVVDSYQEAFHCEHQIKGWSHAKREALIRGDSRGIHEIVKDERKRREQSRVNSRVERNEPTGECRRKAVH